MSAGCYDSLLSVHNLVKRASGSNYQKYRKVSHFTALHFSFTVIAPFISCQSQMLVSKYVVGSVRLISWIVYSTLLFSLFLITITCLDIEYMKICAKRLTNGLLREVLEIGAK